MKALGEPKNINRCKRQGGIKIKTYVYFAGKTDGDAEN